MERDWTNRESNGWGLLLNGLAAIVVLVFRNLGGYIAASILALVGIALVLDGWRRRRNARLAAAPSPAPSEDVRYTSDGLSFRTIGQSIDLSGRSVTLINITHDESGAQLPQPLNLRVTCSRELEDAWGTFYPDRRILDRHGLPSIVKPDGNKVYFKLKEPKLRPPAMLALNLRGAPGAEIEIQGVEYPAPRQV